MDWDYLSIPKLQRYNPMLKVIPKNHEYFNAVFNCAIFLLLTILCQTFEWSCQELHSIGIIRYRFMVGIIAAICHLGDSR